MALGMGIQKQVLSWWPFSLIRFPPTWLCLVYDGISDQQMLRLSIMYKESWNIHFRCTYTSWSTATTCM